MTRRAGKRYEFEAVWWDRYDREHEQRFDDAAAALAWVRGQTGVAGWLIRRRSVHGWLPVSSGDGPPA